MKYVIFGLLIFSLLLAGCIGETTIEPVNEDKNDVIEEVETIEETKLIECEDDDMVCFIEQMVLGNPARINFEKEETVLLLKQKSEGYYITEGCVNDVCIFEMHYTYLDVYMHELTKEYMINEQGADESEIDESTEEWRTSILNTWEGKKMYCEMTPEEAEIYLEEHLQSIKDAEEGIFRGSTDMISAKRCRIIDN
jgi:hypothetical protein